VTIYKSTQSFFPSLKCYWQNKAWYLIHNPLCIAPYSGKEHKSQKKEIKKALKMSGHKTMLKLLGEMLSCI
jgi:hypothetical protein